ncbi:hypothetical protein KIN20_010316 [Parelaphostrongylus tenuis]|uniref:Uncharacterized protein n=1 Tax=Parelaphostrongylus tenuis TaxID=148309 RepID=A0AAD5QLC8_PARTN|nr:hypothetical protein KIN20_010316 [Parelaphostrongylus tenuis]
MAVQGSLYRDLLIQEYELERDARTAFENINRAQAQGLCPREQRFGSLQSFEPASNTNLKDQLCSARSREVEREIVIE